MPRKRSSGDGGLYFLKSRGLWRGVLDLGYWPDGRRRQASVTHRTQAGARAKLDTLKAEVVKYGSPLNRTTTLADWADHWLTTVCRPRLKPNALAAYESITRTWILPNLGKKKVADLKPSDVRAVHQAARQAGKSSATTRKIHNVLSGMLEAARMDGLAERNVADDVTAPAVLQTDRGALTTEQALAVLGAAAQLEDGTRWWTALLAGLRQSERLGARLDSLDLDNGTITVEWALDEIASEHGCGGTCNTKRAGSCPQRRLKVPDGFDHIHLHGRLALIRPKSGRARTVPLLPQLVLALRRYIAATADRPNPYGLIWRKPDGEPYLPDDDQQAWRDLLHTAGTITAEQRKAPKDRTPGTPDIPTTHWARHTNMTVLMELGVDAKIIGEIVGHVDAKTTRGYQHVSTPAARAAMEKLGGHWSAALGS